MHQSNEKPIYRFEEKRLNPWHVLLGILGGFVLGMFFESTIYRTFDVVCEDHLEEPTP